MKCIKAILSAAVLIFSLASCERERVLPLDDIRPGEAVLFSPYVSKAVLTKAADGYEPLPEDYSLTVEMYREGEAKALDTTPLYWPDNVNAYGFKAYAGTEDLEADQSTKEKFLLQDRLEGFGLVKGVAGYEEDAINYRVSKEWYKDNKSLGLPPERKDASYYKEIPLYLKHKRSLVTIKFKAGEGVKQEDLTHLDNMEARIYSYSGGEKQEITPLPGIGKLDTDEETAEYTAVVEPYDYSLNPEHDLLFEVKLSTQRFTFYPANDFEKDDAAHMENYRLEPGKHLVITATLGRDGRKVLITALIEDWDETVTTSVVDDYGQAGDLYQINNRQELREFLGNPKKNKPGNVAIIVPSSINLEEDDDEVADWEPLPLNSTLNMAGSTFRTLHPVFSFVSSSGNLVNGIVMVGDASIPSAVAQENSGTLDHITVLPRRANGELSTGTATVGGLVERNYGVIVSCSSDLPVQGTDVTFVGGIAGTSRFASEAAPMPIIENCTVNARVDAVHGQGGGIVGTAVGRVSHNRFEYGITVLQDPGSFKNIVAAKAEERELRTEENSWPTIAKDELAGNNSSEVVYDATIDSQEELGHLLGEPAFNKSGKAYRLSSGFSISRSAWTYGIKSDIGNGTGYSLLFRLEGNEKTISTNAMIFSNIMGQVENLTVRLSGDITPAEVSGKPQDAVAALAYSVQGADARISNIRVKGGNYTIAGENAGGVVMWAFGGATVENCQCKASIQIVVDEINADAKIYGGGIVACAAQATIARCTFLSTSKTLFRTPDDTSNQIFYGGILGGTVPKLNAGETDLRPEVLITDCTSWFEVPEGAGSRKGAVVGYAMYADAANGNAHTNGLKKGCQGNWWGSSNGLGTYTGGSIEELLGRRNAVTPEYDNNYED